MRRLTGPGAASENSSRPASRIGSGLTRNALPATGAGASSASEAGADSGSGAGADEPSPLAVTRSGAMPVEGSSVSRATGAWLDGGAVAVTTADAVPVAPLSSVTVSRTVQVPAANVWVAVAAVCGPTTVPSPKSNRYD